MTLTEETRKALDEARARRERETLALTEGLPQLPCGCWLKHSVHWFIRRRMTVECRNGEGVIVHTLDVLAHNEDAAKRNAQVRLYREGVNTSYDMHVAGSNTDLVKCCNADGECHVCEARAGHSYCY